MAKRKTFEEIAHLSIRWPTKGDKPFVTAPNQSDNANIHENEKFRMQGMISGYKMAADHLVRDASEDGWVRDQLVYPIIFCYRQFLELSLKQLVADHGEIVGVEPNWKSHDLAFFWQKFLTMLKAFGTEDPDDADPAVRKIVLEFAKIDPESFSFRYPVDNDGDAVPVVYDALHLPALAGVMEATDNYFTGADGYLSELRSV